MPLSLRVFPAHRALSRGLCSATLRLPSQGQTFDSVPLHNALSRGFCSATLRLPSQGQTVDLVPLHNALSRGFSLIEVVLALGVIAFALVGIMGLFPVAMKSAQESQRETRATLIAQQIFSDLRVSAGTNRFVISGPTASTTNGLSLSSDGNLYLAFGTNGSPLASVTSSDFTNSYPDLAASFLANISVDTNTGTSNLSRVQTTIETPAAAPSTSRAKYTFVTLMNY